MNQECKKIAEVVASKATIHYRPELKQKCDKMSHNCAPQKCDMSHMSDELNKTRNRVKAIQS